MTMTPTNTPDPQLPATTLAGAITEKVGERIVATGRYVGASSILLQALNATTLEEATNIGTLLSGKDHVGERIKFLDVEFADSDPALDSKLPWYAIASVVIDGGDGEVQRLGCGAEHVVGVLLRAAELDLFPFDAYLEGKDLGGGMQALNMKLAPTKVASEPGF